MSGPTKLVLIDKLSEDRLSLRRYVGRVNDVSFIHDPHGDDPSPVHEVIADVLNFQEEKENA